MKDLRLIVKVRNNQLQERREATGMGACAFANLLGLNPTRYCALEAMTLSPVRKRHQKLKNNPDELIELRWIAEVDVIAAYHRCRPVDLFPESVQQIVRSRAELRCNAEEASAALSPASVPTPLQLVEASYVNQVVGKAIGVLTPSEEFVIRRRFGMLDESDPGGASPKREISASETYAEVGGAMGLSVERVRQIESNAFRKLRKLRAIRDVGQP